MTHTKKDNTEWKIVIYLPADAWDGAADEITIRGKIAAALGVSAEYIGIDIKQGAAKRSAVLTALPAEVTQPVTKQGRGRPQRSDADLAASKAKPKKPGPSRIPNDEIQKSLELGTLTDEEKKKRRRAQLLKSQRKSRDRNALKNG
jgi:hypothetical protein